MKFDGFYIHVWSTAGINRLADALELYLDLTALEGLLGY
jgi:hypothetical protein